MSLICIYRVIEWRWCHSQIVYTHQTQFSLAFNSNWYYFVFKYCRKKCVWCLFPLIFPSDKISTITNQSMLNFDILTVDSNNVENRNWARMLFGIKFNWNEKMKTQNFKNGKRETERKMAFGSVQAKKSETKRW